MNLIVELDVLGKNETAETESLSDEAIGALLVSKGNERTGHRFREIDDDLAVRLGEVDLLAAVPLRRPIRPRGLIPDDELGKIEDRTVRRHLTGSLSRLIDRRIDFGLLTHLQNRSLCGKNLIEAPAVHRNDELRFSCKRQPGDAAQRNLIQHERSRRNRHFAGKAGVV